MNAIGKKNSPSESNGMITVVQRLMAHKYNKITGIQLEAT